MNEPFKVLDLFSGIGGFSLGLERTGGFKTVAFCEIEPYCRAVLRKHWPGVPCYEDVRTLDGRSIAADVICGGFPCQDISVAGKGDGLDGERSGLWREYFRIIRELRPRYALIENTAALLGRGLSRVLCDLASCGMDAEWDVIPAKAIGAQHLRERIWIVANANGDAGWREYVRRNIQSQAGTGAEEECRQERQRLRAGYGNLPQDDAADALPPGPPPRIYQGADGGYASRLPTRAGLTLLAEKFDRSYWRYQPLLGRGFHGVSNRVDRVGALGNAVVPQIPELIGRAILQAEGRLN